jgi:hypothetical protein
VKVSFADIETAQRAIVDDSEYFNQLQPLEMAAKTGASLTGRTIEQQRAECQPGGCARVHRQPRW